MPFPAEVSFGVGLVVGVAMCLFVTFSDDDAISAVLLQVRLSATAHTAHTHAIKVSSLSMLQCTQCTSAMLGTVMTHPFDACIIYT